MAAKERDGQQSPSRLVGDFKLDITRIGKLVAKLLDRCQRFGASGIEVGQFNPLVILIKIIAVADVEEEAGHGALDVARKSRRWDAITGCRPEPPYRAGADSEIIMMVKRKSGAA